MIDLSVCPKCNSKRLKWDKRFQCGELAGWSYHFHAHCNNCHYGYNVDHNHNYPKKITENYQWTVSKITKKHINKMILNGTLPKFNLPFEVDIQTLLHNPSHSKLPEPIGLF